jgi:hypothetical protein
MRCAWYHPHQHAHGVLERPQVSGQESKAGREHEARHSLGPFDGVTKRHQAPPREATEVGIHEFEGVERRNRLLDRRLEVWREDRSARFEQGDLWSPSIRI